MAAAAHRLAYGPDCDLVALARKTLHEQLERLASDRATIRIPKPSGLMKPGPGQHAHHTPELFVQLSGRTVFHLPSEQVQVLPGDICVLPRDLPHREVAGPWRGPFFNLVFMSDSQKVLFFHLAHEAGDHFPRGFPGRHMEWPDMHRAVRLLDETVAWFHGHDPGRTWAIKGLLLAHFASLLRVIESKTQHIRESFKVTRARQLVSSRLEDPGLSVAGLARELQCSADYLSHLFHKETGTHLARHINDQRLARARALLESSAVSIKEVARAAGYSDAGYFTRLFRQSTGTSPTRYRSTLHLR